MADVNSRLVEAINNQKKIEHDTRQVQLQSAQLTKSATHTTHSLTLPSQHSLSTVTSLTSPLHLTRLHPFACVLCCRQMERWAAMYGGLNNSVKEMGDLSNWAATMQADMDNIAGTLNRLMQQRQQQRREEEEKRRAVLPTVSAAVVNAALPDARAKPQPI